MFVVMQGRSYHQIQWRIIPLFLNPGEKYQIWKYRLPYIQYIIFRADDKFWSQMETDYESICAIIILDAFVCLNVYFTTDTKRIKALYTRDLISWLIKLRHVGLVSTKNVDLYGIRYMCYPNNDDP